MLSGVSSYSSAASFAGPRLSATPRTTSSTRRPRSRVTSSRSPARTSLLAFARWLSTCTRPPLIASAASARVLKMRAAHSHLSTRTESISKLRKSLALTARRVEVVRCEPRLECGAAGRPLVVDHRVPGGVPVLRLHDLVLAEDALEGEAEALGGAP